MTLESRLIRREHRWAHLIDRCGLVGIHEEITTVIVGMRTDEHQHVVEARQCAVSTDNTY